MRTRTFITGLGLLVTTGLLAACSSAATSSAISAAAPASAAHGDGGTAGGTTTAGAAVPATNGITIGVPDGEAVSIVPAVSLRLGLPDALPC